MGFDTIDRQFRQTKQVPTGCVRCGIASELTMCNIAPEGGKEDMVLLCTACSDFHTMMVSPRWFWAIGESPAVEEFQVCATREEAIALATSMAIDDNVEHISVIYAKPFQYNDDVFDSHADEILEWWFEANELTDLETTRAQDADLEAMLTATFTAWRLKHRIGRCEGPDTSEQAECLTLSDEC